MDVMIPLDREASTPLSGQIYNEIRSSITRCRLPAGSRLPSSRDLARQLGVARFTVNDAYERLKAEGYVIGRHGSGTYVVDHPQLAEPESASRLPEREGRRALSAWGQRLPSPVVLPPAPLSPRFNLEAGTPALDEFPWTVWQRLLNRVARNRSVDTQGYGEESGLRELREAIAAYLARSRRLVCTPDEIVVTNGLHQSIDILTRLLLDPGDQALVEEPGYPFVRAVLSVAGARLTHVPVDRDGLRVDRLRAHRSARLLYTTPSHQYPTGSILSLQRRLEVIRWSSESDSVIVEDDYDGDLRYDARPVPSLTGLARERNAASNLVYTGSFSKVLFPALRLGYIVLPPDLVGPFLHAKSIVDRHPSPLLQATVAALITEGHFERHLARMRRLYASRQTALVKAIAHHLPGVAIRDVESSSAGLHLLVRMNVRESERELIQRAADHGIQLYGASNCFASPPPQPHLLLGFSAMPEDRIEAGIERLARMLND